MTRPINKALLKLNRRAEKYKNEHLIKSFVDIGPLFSLMQSTDHQVIYGRRGTGKTHGLRYLENKIKDLSNCVVYVDMRTIGSTGGLYNDTTLSFSERATRLLIDTFKYIHDGILDYTLENDEEVDLSKIGSHLDALSASISELTVVSEEVEQQTESEETKSFGSEVGLDVSMKEIGINASRTDGDSQTKSKTFIEKGKQIHRIRFSSIHQNLKDILKVLNTDIWVIIDEWSEIPLDLQPYLGDLIRKTLLPIQAITVKIGAIDQRTNFRTNLNDGYIGLEVGADLPSSIDLDEYMIFDNDVTKAKTFFKNLIYYHLKDFFSEFSIEGINSADDLVSEIFTNINSFEEFVKASEGVARDAINIIANAAMKADDKKISINDIRHAAKMWYMRDKEKAVSMRTDAIELMRWIVDKVIGQRTARAFLFTANKNSELIDYLFDSRVLHVIKQNVSGKDEPGVRYNVYSIDYGCYVDLINTSKAPKGLFEAAVEHDEEQVFVEVPANDYRSIRRAILDIDEFNNK